MPAELVVGTLIGYDVSRDGEGPPVVRRTSGLLGVANEGSAKVANIQTQLGRRPILAAGNSGVTGRCWNGHRPPALPALRC